MESKSTINYSDIIPFDLATLEHEFQKVCPDYFEDLSPSSSSLESMSLTFAKRILMDVGPADSRRQARNQTSTKHWRINICRNAATTEDENPPNAGVCFISSTDNGQCPKAYGSYMVLSLLQAGLLAVNVFNKTIDSNSKHFLTPMSCVTFSRTAICRIASVTGENVTSIGRAINASCQPNGFHLTESRAHIAMLAAIIWNILKDKLELKKEVSLALKQYGRKGKYVDLVAFDKYAECLDCAVSPDMNPENLRAKFKAGRADRKGRSSVKFDRTCEKEAEDIVVRFARIVLKNQSELVK